MPTGDWKVATARPAIDRVLERVVVTEDGCWEFQGCRGHHGHGKVKIGSRRDGTQRSVETHIVVWEHFNGPVPDGLELDHLCENPPCCNPGHLEPVTHTVNLARSDKMREARRRNCAIARSKRWAA